jgi:hypothetical protein
VTYQLAEWVAHVVSTRRFRLSALFAGAAVIAATVLPAFPAAAEDTPTPDPAVTTEPTAEPTSEPTPEATPTEEPAPEVTPTQEPTATPTPTPTPSATPAGATTTVSGTIQTLSDEGQGTDPNLVYLGVEGQGYLSIDIAALDPKPTVTNPVVLTVKIPSGLKLSSNANARFTQLANAGAVSPLVAVASEKIKQTAPKETSALVNQTPSISATHHVFAVYVSPIDRPSQDAAQMTNAAAQAQVAYADSYWNSQSGGNIRFVLDGVVPWYQSSYTCQTDSGNTSLWNQGMTKAKAQGFIPGKNMHLLLIFPNDAPNYDYCGGPIGLGTIGGSVNQGGMTWVMGSSDAMAKETIAHEFGHNLSLGHASWLACPSPTPIIGKSVTNYDPGSIDNCDVRNYGDTSDVMGFGMGDGVGGTLSSPQAIRAGIWPSNAFLEVPAGTTSHTINALSTFSGLRSLVVQGTDGVVYFVEMKNVQGADSTNYAGCTSQLCTINGPHVRILRYEPTGWSGFPGEDTYLLGRSNTSVGYTAAGTYTMEGGGTIAVTAVNATTANVTVTRSAAGTVVSNDWIQLYRFLNHDNTLRVGDSMTLALGDYWNAETYDYTWLRNGSPISGANDSTYVLTSSDIGKYINAYVRVNGTSTKRYDNRGGPGAGSMGYGPVAAGPANATGTVSINATSVPFQAVTPIGGAANWPTGTTFKYQWLKGSSATTVTTAITGATAATYTPASSDTFLRLRVTATVPGHTAVTRYSGIPVDYGIRNSAVPVVSGIGKVGTQLTSTFAPVYKNGDNATISGITPAYQWLRNGVVIPGAVGPNYVLTSADFNAKITLRATGTKSGYGVNVVVSQPLTISQKGTIAATTPAVALTTNVDAPGTFLVQTNVTGVSEPLTSTGFQWYRVNITSGVTTAITGATAATYRPVAADYAYKLRVIATVKKLNYDNLPITSLTKDYSIRVNPTTPLGFNSAPAKVDNTISYNPGIQFKVEQDNGTVSTLVPTDAGVVGTLQWYRKTGTAAPVAIAAPQGTNAIYTIQGADVGKVLSYKLTVKYAGRLPIVNATSPSTAKVVLATFAHNQDVTITSTGLVKHANANVNDVTPLATGISYQWTRNGVAIAGATTANYTLTAADYGKVVKAKVTYTKSGYTSYSQLDVNGSGNYWIRANSVLPTILGTLTVGGVLSVGPRTYFDMIVPVDGMTIPSGDIAESHQWYRAGVAIAGASDPTYTLVSADKGKAITVKVTAQGAPGLYTYDLPSIATSAATVPIGTALLPGADTPAPTLVVQPSSTPAKTVLGFQASGVLTPNQTGITSPGGAANKVTYQWYRDGAAITGATKATYTLVAADRLHQIKLRIVTSHAAIGATSYTTDIRYTDAKDFAITLDGNPLHVPRVAGNSWTVGTQVEVFDADLFKNADENPIAAPTVAYQWLRSGVVISGATAAQYNLIAADYNKNIQVRVTVSKLGYLPLVYTTTTSVPLVGKGVDNNAWYPVVQEGPGNGILTAAVSDLSPVTPAPAYTYKWFRNGSFITGATAKTYKLVAADSDKLIKVQVTMTRTNFEPLVQSTKQSGEAKHTIFAGAGKPLITGTTTVGELLTAAAPDFYDDLAHTGTNTTYTPVFTWYRTGVAISGATGPTYTLVAADLGKKITVKVTATQAGRLSAVSVLSDPTATVTVGTIDAGSYKPVPTVNLSTRKATITFTGTAVTTGLATTYKWYRNGAAISGATASSYTLLATDTNKSINVVVTLTKPGFTSYPYPIPTVAFGPAQAGPGLLVNGFTQAEDAVIVGTPAVGNTLNCVPPLYYRADTSPVNAPGTAQTLRWINETDAVVQAASSTGFDYIVQPTDSGHSLRCVVTIGATLHKTQAETTVATGIVP